MLFVERIWVLIVYEGLEAKGWTAARSMEQLQAFVRSQGYDEIADWLRLIPLGDELIRYFTCGDVSYLLYRCDLHG